MGTNLKFTGGQYFLDTCLPTPTTVTKTQNKTQTIKILKMNKKNLGTES